MFDLSVFLSVLKDVTLPIPYKEATIQIGLKSKTPAKVEMHSDTLRYTQPILHKHFIFSSIFTQPLAESVF